MDPHLQRLQQQIADAISIFNSEQLAWHQADKWSASEVLEHLYLTYTGTLKGCGRVLENGRPMISPSTLKKRAQSMIVVGLGYMPSGRKSPAVAQPRGLGPEKVVPGITGKIGEMDAALSQCAERFGTRAKVLDHPVLGPFSVAQWRKFHLVHGLHHVKQIRRLGEQVRTTKAQPSLVQK